MSACEPVIINEHPGPCSRANLQLRVGCYSVQSLSPVAKVPGALLRGNVVSRLPANQCMESAQNMGYGFGILTGVTAVGHNNSSLVDLVVKELD